MKKHGAPALTRKETLDSFLNSWKPSPETEYVPLSEARGRFAAEDLYSENTLPPYRVSSFDGYAVKSAAFANGIPDMSSWVKGVDYVNADTGDDFPDEYDTIIAVEDFHFDENGIPYFDDDFEFKAGENIRGAGTQLKAGDLLVKKNVRITTDILVALASGGIRFVPVYKKVKVAFIPTGSELIAAGTIPYRGTNIDTNSILAKNYLEDYGAEPLLYPIIKDTKEHLRTLLCEAVSQADIVIINGGSSKGSEDFNTKLLEELGSFYHHGVKAAPGRPVGTALIDGKPVINVPGPSLACWLGFDWLIKPLVYFYYGAPLPKRPTVQAKVVGNIGRGKGAPLEVLKKVHVAADGDGFIVSDIPKSTGIGETALLANGFVPVPIGTCYSDGDIIEVELLGSKPE